MSPLSSISCVYFGGLGNGSPAIWASYHADKELLCRSRRVNLASCTPGLPALRGRDGEEKMSRTLVRGEGQCKQRQRGQGMRELSGKRKDGPQAPVILRPPWRDHHTLARYLAGRKPSDSDDLPNLVRWAPSRRCDVDVWIVNLSAVLPVSASPPGAALAQFPTTPTETRLPWQFDVHGLASFGPWVRNPGWAKMIARILGPRDHFPTGGHGWTGGWGGGY